MVGIAFSLMCHLPFRKPLLEVWVLNSDFLWIRPRFIQEEETARLIFRLLDPDGHDYKPRAMSAGEAVSALSRPQPDAWLLAA